MSFHATARGRAAQFVDDDRMDAEFLRKPCEIFFRRLLNVDPLHALILFDFHKNIVTWALVRGYGC